MNRRELLSKLVVAAPTLVTVSLLNVPLDKHKPDDFMYRGWRVKWDGWLGIMNTDAKVGRWLAYSPRRLGWQLFSSWPGKCGSYYHGMMFDVSLQKWQTLPTIASTSTDLAHYQSECLERLKRLIEKCGPPLLEEPIYLD